jgi:hypothetical protein
MNEKVRISFEESPHTGEAQRAVVYNPRVMPTALLSQVMRFGLKADTHGGTSLSGRLKGSREALVGVIQSYGVSVDIVPPTRVLP